MGRGGYREGAGRKPSPIKKEAFTTTITAETKATLYSIRERTGLTISEMIEEMAAAMDRQLRILGK